MQMLEPMPPALREAMGEYSVRYSSPLSRAMDAQEAAGFMRSIETTKELVAVTQDASLLDVYDMDVATPAMARIQGTPENWLASPEQIAEKRAQRAKAQARQEQIQAAPAAAALMKAEAATQAAGMAPQTPMGQQQ
jgi:hypothetical protein